MSFRVEYRRGTAGAAMFQRQLRFQVDISTVSKPSCPKEYLYAVTFTLLSGNVQQINILAVKTIVMNYSNEVFFAIFNN